MQRAQEQGRPPASTVLDRLKEYVDHWGESINPLVPEFWREDVLTVPEKIPHFIHVPPTAADSDDDDPPSITHFDDDDTARQNTPVSDFCDRIDHPVVDD